MVEKTELDNGLNMAEIIRTSLDHLADSTVTDEVIRFVGINIDQIETLVKALNIYDEKVAEQKARDTMYSRMVDELGNLNGIVNSENNITSTNMHELISVALASAGARCAEKRSIIDAMTEDLLELSGKLSRIFVEYFQTRCQDTLEININGNTYNIRSGFLVRNVYEDDSKRQVVFGSKHEVLEMIRENPEPTTPAEKKKYIKPRFADSHHIGQFLEDLIAVSKF